MKICPDVQWGQDPSYWFGDSMPGMTTVYVCFMSAKRIAGYMVISKT